MSWHYEPVARPQYHIRCLGEEGSHNQKPCNFVSNAESAGQAEAVAKKHIDALANPEDYSSDTPNRDHMVIITPVTVVSRHIN